MLDKLNSLIDTLSDFFATRKGLLPLIGIVFVIINAVFQFFPGLGWLTTSNLFLHIGVILAILGFLVAWAL